MKTLCEIFGHTKLHTIYLEDKTSGYCQKCNPHHSFRKGNYDLEILGNNKCPHCGTILKHPKTISNLVCDNCGYGKKENQRSSQQKAGKINKEDL